jgi:hypothetical protein
MAVPLLRPSEACLLPRSRDFDYSLFHVEFVVEKVALEHTSVREIRSFLASIISPLLCAPSFIYYQCYIFSPFRAPINNLLNKRGNVRVNVKSRRVRVTINVVEKQYVLRILNVCIALVIQHEPCLSSVACLVLPYFFHTIS